MKTKRRLHFYGIDHLDVSSAFIGGVRCQVSSRKQVHLHLMLQASGWRSHLDSSTVRVHLESEISKSHRNTKVRAVASV